MQSFVTDMIGNTVTSFFNRNEKKAPLIIDKKDGLKTKVISLNGYVKQQFLKNFMYYYSQCEFDENIIVEVTTNGGDVSVAYKIAQTLQRHKGNVTVRIPYYAMSAGTIIALAADQIVLSHCGCLGSIDPSVNYVNVPVGLEVLKQFNGNISRTRSSICTRLFPYLDLKTHIANIFTQYSAKIMKKISKGHESQLRKLLNRYENGEQIYKFFTYNHDHLVPFYREDLTDLKLNLTVDNSLLNHIFVRDTSDIPDINIAQPTTNIQPQPQSKPQPKPQPFMKSMNSTNSNIFSQFSKTTNPRNTQLNNLANLMVKKIEADLKPEQNISNTTQIDSNVDDSIDDLLSEDEIDDEIEDILVH